MEFQLFLLVVVLLALSVNGCDFASCRNDARANEDDFVRCDMCNCDGLDELSGNPGTCTTSNDNMYNCYVKYDAEEFTWTCSLRMKIGYILLFVFISLFGCFSCIYCCSVVEKQQRKQRWPESDSNNINVVLIDDNFVGSAQAQPVVVVQSSSSYTPSTPVVVSTPVDNSKM
mmetsp:Transcript_17997/g.30118  ORF Transcript_17997/g.30118 Transcript_17997/m.30118 type:complete len:172 (+) Transcript_17997:57-572(+)